MKPVAFSPLERTFARPFVSPLAAEQLEYARARARGLEELDAAMLVEMHSRD
eukprot:COSAG05_NODE_3934_length_1767_cov_1.594724_1_plen_52_part_00